MATGKRPDPKRRKTTHPHATHLGVKNGEKVSAYKAGELYGCYTHRTFAAQPCVGDITNGELSCPLCASGLVPEWRGYVPLWDRDWTLRYVLINENFFETVDVIPWHAQVTVCRAKNPISPVVIREEMTMTRELPSRKPWSDEIHMLNICLTLWKNQPLTDWVLAKQSLALAPVPKAETKPAPKPRVTPYRAPSDDGPQKPELDVVMERIKNKTANLKPSTNGNGKPH